MEEIVNIFLAATFGAIFGSYATLFAYRLPLKESCFGRYFGPKSRCPVCSSIIKTRDLVPLFNWLFTLGRCRNCQTKIPRTHLFLEVATTILFTTCYLKFGWSEEFILYALLSVSLAILLVCDYTHKVFPFQALNFILISSLLIRVLQEHEIIGIIYSLTAGVIFASIFYQIFHVKSKGKFANQDQVFDYIKFILIASVAMPIKEFLFYFLTIMVIFTTLLMFNLLKKKKHSSFGYVLIIPFLWIILFPTNI